MQGEFAILARLKEGDDSAFDWVYRNCYRKATAFVRAYNGSEEDAEDFFQEAMLVLVEKLRNPDFELNAACATFLYTVVRNLWVHSQRKAGRVISFEKDQLEAIPGSEEEDFSELWERIRMEEQESERMRAGLRQIGEECRQVLLLRFYEKKSEEEIAALLHYEKDFVKVKRSRCLKKLRELMGL